MALKPTHLQCHCAQIHEPASLLRSLTLPFSNDFCHCDTCRHSTGSLGTWFAAIKGRPSEKSMSNVTAYRVSDKVTRYFCSNCGCNVFVCVEKEGRWLACAGIVEVDLIGNREAGGYRDVEDASKGLEKEDRYGKEERNLSKIMYHEYVDDAKDGGLAPYLTKVGGRDVPSYETDPDEGGKPLKANEVFALRENADISTSARDENIRVACHCGGVELKVAPPPYTENSEGWYVPSDRSKYYARLCNCRSCRLTLGFTFQPWTYIPPTQLFASTGEQLICGSKAKETVQIEKLKHYQSSEFVLRSFCTTCGATMYYQSFERPYIINVSVGVLRSKVGNVMAREWLQWDHKVVSKREEAVDEEMIEAWLRG